MKDCEPPAVESGIDPDREAEFTHCNTSGQQDLTVHASVCVGEIVLKSYALHDGPRDMLCSTDFTIRRGAGGGLGALGPMNFMCDL